MRIVFLVAGAALAVACSSSSSSSSSSGSSVPQGDGGTDATEEPAPVPDTWSGVYAAYFASGTPGHCGNSGCHATQRGGFKCGADKDTCYQGLVDGALINLADPSTSLLVNTKSSPLSWFGGQMPQDDPKPNAAAAAAVSAWIKAGAKND